ncbi:hypothetical protein CPB85DRAFT_1210427 [Mucidula mucida]|nr:hypothetical protein CPB85DRAFT_1210427 [Mucidula mucida]
MPEWVTKSIRSKRNLRVLLRCSVACWAAYVIILPNASLRKMGTLAFFSLLTSLFLPPYIPVQLFFFMMTTIMLGMLLGWGLGVAAMRAANASRDPGTLQAAYAAVNATCVVSGNSPVLAQTTAIYTGVFLDERASAVYGCFLGATSFVMALFRAYAPTLIFLSIFGTIAIDIFATVGPLFPTARYTILKSMAISVSCYFAVGLVCTILIFPETMNHAVLNDLSEQLERLRALVQAQNDVLSFRSDDLQEEMVQLNQKTKKARSVIVASQTQLAATSRFIHLEFSWGKWSGDDVLDLFEPLLALVTRVAALQSFGQMLCMSQHMFDAPHVPNMPDTSDTYLLRQVHEMNTVVEEEHKVRILDILPILDESTRELRAACLQGIESIKRSLDLVNKGRWRSNPDMVGAVRDGLESDTALLQAAVHAFKEEHRLELLKPFIPIVENHVLTNALPLRSLYVSYVFGSTMVGVAEATIGLMILVGDTMEKRRKNRLWAPKGLRKLWKILSARGDQNNGVLGEDVSPHPAGGNITAEEEMNYRRDPDSSAPTNAFQKFMHLLSLLWRWMQTPEFVFALKYVVISVALWIPAVVNKSAAFYYREKGIWALIMAQTMINLYAADQIFNLVTRLIGTFLGLVMGLLVWYLGNAKSTGSPYGSAAAVAVFIPLIVFIRVFSPVQYVQGVILGCATFALVVGYSWVDGHTSQIVTPGIGWSVAWKRWVLVVIGCGASSAIMFFPPTSGRKAVRLRNASSIASLSKLYGYLMSTWISDNKDPKAKDAWMDAFRKKVMAASMEMRTIRDLTDLAKWEGSIRGKWASHEYIHLVEVQIEMIASMVQLGGALTHLDDEWRVAFLTHTGVLNPNFIADVMGLFTVISQSLRTAEPLHEVLPETLLEKLFYHQQHYVTRSNTLTIEHVQSVNYMYYASGVVAVYQLLHSLDALHKITKNLCGEEPLSGFNRWKTQFERSKESEL